MQKHYIADSRCLKHDIQVAETEGKWPPHQNSEVINCMHLSVTQYHIYKKEKHLYRI